jgi:hypothetical protein
MSTAMRRRNRHPAYIVLKNFTLHQRIAGVVDCAKHEDDIGDTVIELLTAVRVLSSSLPARHRARVGLLMHDYSVGMRRSTIRIAYRALPHRVTRYPDHSLRCISSRL